MSARRHLALARLLFLVTAALTLGPGPARAQWTEYGARIYSASGPVAITDVKRYSQGGFVAFNPMPFSMDIQRMDADGVARWTEYPSSSAIPYESDISYGFFGSTWATATNGDIHVGWDDLLFDATASQFKMTPKLQRVDSGKQAQWDLRGLRVFPTLHANATNTTACSGGSADVIVAAIENDSVTNYPWRLRMQRVGPDSVRAWGFAGLALSPAGALVSSQTIRLEPDGAGGAYLVWAEDGSIPGNVVRRRQSGLLCRWKEVPTWIHAHYPKAPPGSTWTATTSWH